MKYEELEQIIAEKFMRNEHTQKRYVHIQGVIKMALKINDMFDFKLDEEKLKTAALLHDYAKLYHKDEVLELLRQNSTPEAFEMYQRAPKVCHSILGAILVKKELNIDDPDIISAIRYHTTGNPNMNLLDKIIFVSDAIEENRNYAGVEELRESLKIGFDECFTTIITRELMRLISINVYIFEDTFATYNAFVAQKPIPETEVKNEK